jgi:hypothetical protein
MKKVRILMLAVFVMIVAAMGLWVGCEESPTEVSIEVNPPLATTTNWYVQTFVASLPGGTGSTRRLYYPLEWSLSDPSLGRFRSTAGDTAVYETMNWPGVQTITVRDQAGSEGTAGVAQRSAP